MNIFCRRLYDGEWKGGEGSGGEGRGAEASSCPSHTSVCKISRLYYGAISLLISNVSPAGKLGKLPALFSSVNGSSLTGLSQNLKKKKNTTFEGFIHCSFFASQAAKEFSYYRQFWP